MADAHILVVDDDPQIRRVMRTALGAHRYDVQEAGSGEEAVARVHAEKFDVILLDINLPGISGLETCQKIRLWSDVPIIVITVRDSEKDKVEALDAGADDYITKPFSIPELTARLRSAIRRSHVAGLETEMPIVIDAIELDPARRIVRKAGAALRLTPKEFDLLHYLMRRPGLPVAHARLLRAVWGEEYGQELEYLRTFVHQLRRKLEDDPSSPEYLLTELHFGYRFRQPS